MPTETIDTNITDMQPDAFDLAFDAAASNEPPIEIAPPEPVVPEPVVVAPEPPVVPEPVVVAPVVPEPPPVVVEPPPAPVAPEPFKFSDEEQALFDAVAEQYPEVVPLFDLLEKKITATRDATRQQALEQTTATVTQQFAPVVTEAQMSARSRWESQVLGAHADAFTILPQVEAWVQKQPSILQSAYNAVLDRGTPAETIELLNMVKKSPEFAPPPTPPPAVDPTVEERLTAQEGVRSRRTVDRGAALDPNDFDSAFDRFAGKASA